MILQTSPFFDGNIRMIFLSFLDHMKNLPLERPRELDEGTASVSCSPCCSALAMLAAFLFEATRLAPELLLPSFGVEGIFSSPPSLCRAVGERLEVFLLFGFVFCVKIIRRPEKIRFFSFDALKGRLLMIDVYEGQHFPVP